MAIKNIAGEKTTAKKYAQEAIWAALQQVNIEMDKELTDKDKVKVKEQIDKILTRVQRQLGDAPKAGRIPSEDDK
jgi:hypothetical protein